MSYIGNQPLSVAFQTDSFSGTGSQTVFTMSVAPANTASCIVAITGVIQDPSTYSVSGTTLTFSAAPPTGTNNISVRYLGIPASGVTTTAYRQVTNFTATAGQTTFTPPSYTAGYINVYRNGVMLGTADYTATNGTTVVLATAASAGDLIIVESFYVSSVLNAIPATTGSVIQSYLGAGVAGTGPAFSAYQSVQQTLTAATNTRIQFQTKEYDTASCFDATTNYRFTPNVAGYYQCNSAVNFNAYSSTNLVSLYKNGSEIKRGTQIAANGVQCTASGLIYLNGTTDYVECYAYCGAGGTLNAAAALTFFQASLTRAA